MEISIATRRTVRENIVFSLGVKLAVMAFAAVGHATMWAAVFADVGVAMLAIPQLCPTAAKKIILQGAKGSIKSARAEGPALFMLL